MVSYKDRTVLMLHKLHDCPIQAISATESYCVTASSDKYIRVCPLDFQSFFLHCYHEAPLSGVDLTTDGMKVFICYDTDFTVGVLSRRVVECKELNMIDDEVTVTP